MASKAYLGFFKKVAEERRHMQPGVGDRVPHLEHLILQKHLLAVPRP
jgi:hypothetical protein